MKHYGYILIDTPELKEKYGPEQAVDEYQRGDEWRKGNQGGPFAASLIYRRPIDPGEGYELIPEGELDQRGVGIEFFTTALGWCGCNGDLLSPSMRFVSHEDILAFRRKKCQEQPTVKAFDPTKPVRIRDGRRAEILCTDLTGDYPIVAKVWCENNVTIYTYMLNGKGSLENNISSDLINIPEEKVLDCWINVYACTCVHWGSREDADKHSREGRIACLHIVQKYTPGEGL